MTIDGVIRLEESDGDGFKYGGWFFPVAVRGDGGRGGRAAGQADGSAEESENSPQRHGEHRVFLEHLLVTAERTTPSDPSKNDVSATPPS